MSDPKTQLRIYTGHPITDTGQVALVIFNCQTIMASCDGEVYPIPGIKMSAREAMEVGMNLIHIAKLAESFKQQEEIQHEG